MDHTAQDRPIVVGIDGTPQAIRAGESLAGWVAIGSITRHVMTDAACPVAIIEHDRSHIEHDRSHKVHSLDLGSATGRRTDAVDIPV
jgi:hypothetical protein